MVGAFGHCSIYLLLNSTFTVVYHMSASLTCQNKQLISKRCTAACAAGHCPQPLPKQAQQQLKNNASARVAYHISCWRCSAAIGLFRWPPAAAAAQAWTRQASWQRWLPASPQTPPCERLARVLLTRCGPGGRPVAWCMPSPPPPLPAASGRRLGARHGSPPRPGCPPNLRFPSPQSKHARGQIVNLLRVSLEEGVDPAVRQVAAISFKHLVKRDWTADGGWTASLSEWLVGLWLDD